MYKTLLWEIKNEIGHIILNQPPANKMSMLFFDEFNDLVSNKINQKKIKAVLVYGKGRHFSSGADLDDLLTNINMHSEISEKGEIVSIPDFLVNNTSAFSKLEKFNIPVIAAIRGACLGSAFELALSCHYRICAERSVLGMPEVSFNLMPGCGGTLRLLKLTGKAKAIKIILESENILAEDALKLNIIDKITDKKGIITEAIKFAEKITKNV